VAANWVESLAPFRMVAPSLSAAANARQVENRWAGSMDIALASTSSIAVRSGRRVVSRGGGYDNLFPITATGLESTNGGAPVSRWYAVAARAYWSARPSRAHP
jgi:hypothetical protein